MRKATITTILLFVCTICIAQETKTFKKDNISFEYPKHWITRDFPGYYILVSEPPKEQMSVMTTFDVSREEGYRSLVEYASSYESKLRENTQFKDFRIKLKREFNFKGMKAIEYNCSASASDFPIEWKSVIFQKDGKIYKLSTTSLVGQFTLQTPATDKIFETFKID